MLAIKRGADDLARFSDENKRTCSSGGETTESLISGESDQGVWREMSAEVKSNLSKSVVSLVLSNGQTVLFASSGIAIECQRNVTKFLTSANLVRALKDATKRKDAMRRCDDVWIEVRHDGNVRIGLLEEYDLDHEIAVVKVMSLLDVCGVPLHHEVKFLPNCEVVAVGRDVSGNLVIRSGRLTVCSWASQPDDSKYQMFSTCKFSKDLQGAALFDIYRGNFVGMNLFSDVEGSIFLPRSIIHERLEHLRTYPQRRVFVQLARAVRDNGLATGDKLYAHAEACKDFLNKTRIGYLVSLGYPRPSLHEIDRDMILINTFEEPFGDEYTKGAWSELGRRVSSNIFRNVVALASFNGERRFFACTGFFINFDNEYTTIMTSASLIRCLDGGMKIVEGLRISVLLPNKQHREGILRHYSLQHNVALVTIENFRAVRPLVLKPDLLNLSSKLVAVGRCYQSGVLMAASGIIVDNEETPECGLLGYSTCKITKAGIGGPLVDVDGKFIGMNFYGQIEGTPFVPCETLWDIMQFFKTSKCKAYPPEYMRLAGGWGNLGLTYSWLVPEPRWHVPRDEEQSKAESSMEKYESDQEESMVENPTEKYEREVRASGPYRYVAGALYVLK
ncbi:hypothetical protein ACP70R_011825 [Stipagrostis hirtigluma subsp. patula]